MTAWLLLALLTAGRAWAGGAMNIFDGPNGLVVFAQGVVLDPATGEPAEPLRSADYAGTGRVTVVAGSGGRSPMLRHVPSGVVAWDAVSGRDLGRVLPADASEGVLTPDGSVAVLRTPDGLEGWSTARGKRLWRAPDPFPPKFAGSRWRAAGGGVVIVTSDEVFLIDPATGRHAWTLTREQGGDRLRGDDGDCLLTKTGIAEGTCPTFTPTPAPVPLPGAEAHDPLAALYPGSHSNPRLVALARERKAARAWPLRADPPPALEGLSLEPDPTMTGLSSLSRLLEALDLAVLPSAVTGRVPRMEVNGYTLRVPLRPSLPTVVSRGEGGDDDASMCDALWIDPPKGSRDPGGFDRPRMDLDAVLGADRQDKLGLDAEPITVFDADPSHAALFGLGPGEAIVVDAQGIVRWRGSGSATAEMACRLVLAGPGQALPDRSVTPIWAYRPPTPTNHVQAVAGGVVAWGQRGLVVLDADGGLRWKRDGEDLRVEVRPDQLIVNDRHNNTRLALALRDGQPMAEGPAGPPRNHWSAEGEGGRLEAIGYGPLAWFEGDRAVAWAPGRPWQADVAGRRGYAWQNGQIIAWEAP